MKNKPLVLLGEGSESDQDRGESGAVWLSRLITMKVGPLKHVKPTAKLKHLGLVAKAISCRMMSRPAGLEAKKSLETS